MIIKHHAPRQDPETGEWRCNGKWWDKFPSEELEADEGAYDDYWDREYDRKRDEEGKYGR